MCIRDRLEAEGETYVSDKLLIATGSAPVVPPIPGLREGLTDGFVMTNREILDLEEIPANLVVIGGGVIGLETVSYTHLGNRPYNGYYHIPPVPPVYGCGRGQGQPYGGQNGQHPQGQGYGVPYGQPPVNPYYQNAANGANSSASAKNGQKPQKKRMSKGLIAFICVACCVAVGVIGLSIGIIAGKALGKIDFNDKDPSFSVIEGNQAGSPSDFDLNTEGATDRTMRCV